MNCRCKLCGKIFPETEMSEEHYPAKSVGNDDVVAVDIVKMYSWNNHFYSWLYIISIRRCIRN